MKKIYLMSITISLGLGVLFPWLVYKIFGFFWNYAPVKEKYVDISAVILLITLLLIAIVVGFSKHGKKSINFAEVVKSTLLYNQAIDHLYLISIAINILNVLLTGDYQNFLEGAANGTILAYLQLFFDIRILYYLAILKAYKNQKMGKIIFYSLLYVVISILYSSRSGLFWMAFFNICLIAGVRISKAFKQKIMLLIMVAIMLAPIVFSVATTSRGGAENTIEYMAKIIVARLSDIEISGIELEQYIEGTYNEEIFVEKYGLKNQIAQAINSLLPGDIFQSDVQPNQYWRVVFSGWTVEAAREHYTSIYMILPMYLFLKYDGIPGIILCVLFFYILFRIICKMKDPAIASFMAGYLFYTFFQYFDWAYHIRDLTCFALTILVVRVYEKILKRVRLGRHYFYERNEGISGNTSL